jgi:hypothetical protein
MTQTEILNELENLSVKEQLEVIAAAVQILQERFREIDRPVRAATKKLPLADAAKLLLADYVEDDELTNFTVLDGEDFYG